MISSILLFWALAGLIGRVHGKCSLASIDNERLIAYACIHSDLNDLNELPVDTEWIEFSVSRFHTIHNDAFHRFPNLRRLSFYNCHVKVIEPAAFRGLNRLDWLIFRGTRIHAIKTTWFRHLPNLRKLILDRCGLVYIEPDVFRTLPRLETLDLRDNDLDCLSVIELSYLTMLKTVRIDGNPWLCDCRRRMENFFHERRIVQLLECKAHPKICVTQNLQCMTQIDVPLRPPTITIEHIASRERPGSHFETSVLTSLDRLSDKTTSIEILGLWLDRLPAYTFFRFGNSLRSLELRNCTIGTIEPGAFAGLHQLQQLTLIGNRLPVVSAHWFGDLVALRQLVLAHNNIERIEPGALRPLAGSLSHLDIRFNRLRCLPLDELAYLRRLERLEAVGNPWNCECRRQLQRFLTERNVGFGISGGRCYQDNEVLEPSDGGKYPSIDTTKLVNGYVYWTSFEEILRNITMTTSVTVRPTIEIQTERPPVYKGTCIQDRNERSHQVFICNGINSLSELSVIPYSAHTIRIAYSNLKVIPRHAFARFDGWLSRLELRDCGIETIEYRAFADLYNLEYLSLRNNQLESVTSNELEGLSNLRYLDLSRNHIYRITNDAFHALLRLRSLDVSGNRMNCIGVEHMAHRLSYLTALNVTDNPWSCLCGSKLANFLDSRKIPYDRASLLDMSDDCYVTGTSGPTTTQIVPTTVTTRPPIRNESAVGSCTVHRDPAGPRYRCVGGNLALLKSIPRDAISIEFYEGDLFHLPAGTFYNFPNLRELIIRKCGLMTIEAGAFHGLDSLERLTIQDNSLTSIEVDWFNLQRLERLDLRGNSIYYIAPGAFRHLRKLIYLNLEGNDLRCIFSSDLQDMPNLHVIEFSGNPLKWRCRVDLEQFLETRKIKFVRVEESCEGKKIIRHLLYQNRTQECPSGYSVANKFEQKSLIIFTMFVLSFAMRMH